MKEVPISQGLVALVDDADYEAVSTFRWTAYKNKNTHYAQRQIAGTKKHISMHRFIMGDPQGKVIDHIDHDGLNNQRRNLRAVSVRENNLNKRGLPSNNSSGISGVSWHKASQKWSAHSRLEGRGMIHLGLFKTKEQAAMAVVNYNGSDRPHVKGGNKTGVKGLELLPKGRHRRTTDRWRVTRVVKGIYYYLGTFKTKKEAVKKLRTFEKKLNLK